MDRSTPGSSVLHYLLEFAQIHAHWVSDAIWPFHPLLPLLPLASLFRSIRVFSTELALHIRWPKSWSFRFTNSPSNEYSGLISFMIDWFDLLAVQGTLKSLQNPYLPWVWLPDLNLAPFQEHFQITSVLYSPQLFILSFSRFSNHKLVLLLIVTGHLIIWKDLFGF